MICGEAMYYFLLNNPEILMKNSLTLEDVESTIVAQESVKVGSQTTVVVLTLKNGFEVVGTSACVDPARYDHEVGTKYARERALAKVWELEGYALKYKMQEALQCKPCTEAAPESLAA